MIKDSNQLEKLLASFRSAEQRVNKVLFQTNPKTVQQLKISLDRELKTVTLQLSTSAKKWVNSDLKTAYNEGASKIGNLPSGKTDGGIKQDAILNPYIELTESISKATEQTRQMVNNIINKSLNNGTTSIYDVKKALQTEIFKQNSSMVVKYSNGANMPLSAYSSMVARTARIEASNTGSLNRCQAMNYDLVKCTIVPNCCPFCKRFEGKVYSISGKDNRFPYLYDKVNGPFQNGYNIMHPNCRHEFLPYIEQLQTAEQLKNDEANSKNLTQLPKNDKVFRVYQDNQKKLQVRRTQYNEYNKLKQFYGNKFPYKTLGGFRRAWNVNSPLIRQIKTYQHIDEKKSIYHRPIDYFSKEEKAKAIRYEDKLKAHNAMLVGTKAVWSKLDTNEKVAMTRYTEDSMDYNYSLRDSHWFDKMPEEGVKYIKNNIERLTSVLDKCELPQSMTLRRSISLDVFCQKYLKTDIEDFLNKTTINPKHYVNTLCEDKSFVSTSASFDAEFGDFMGSDQVVCEIYAPKNTKGLYIEPLSYYGGNKDHYIDVKRAVKVWDGEFDCGKPKKEVEVLLQRDCKFKITNMFYDKENKLHVGMDLIKQGGANNDESKQ